MTPTLQASDLDVEGIVRTLEAYASTLTYGRSPFADNVRLVQKAASALQSLSAQLAARDMQLHAASLTAIKLGDDLRAAEANLAAANKQIEEMREALGPFAAFADALNERVPDNIAIGIYADGGMRFGPSDGANVGSLRAARTALSHEAHNG